MLSAAMPGPKVVVEALAIVRGGDYLGWRIQEHYGSKLLLFIFIEFNRWGCGDNSFRRSFPSELGSAQRHDAAWSTKRRYRLGSCTRASLRTLPLSELL